MPSYALKDLGSVHVFRHDRGTVSSPHRLGGAALDIAMCELSRSPGSSPHMPLTAINALDNQLSGPQYYGPHAPDK